MGLFGGSKVTQTQQTEITNIHETRSYGATDRGSIVEGSSHVTIINQDIDPRTVEEAFDFARAVYEETNESFADVIGLTEEALAQSEELTEEAFGLTESLAQQALELSDSLTRSATDKIARAYETAHEKDVKLKNNQIAAILGGVILLGLWAVTRRKKG